MDNAITTLAMFCSTLYTWESMGRTGIASGVIHYGLISILRSLFSSDLGWPRDKSYRYIFIHLFQSWHVQDAIRLSLQLGSWMYSNSCLEGANGWRPQATQANYRASLLIATTTPEKNIIVTIRSLLTIPPKSGNQKKSITVGEQTRFQKNPWILAIYIYIPYFGTTGFLICGSWQFILHPIFTIHKLPSATSGHVGENIPFWASNPRSLPCLTWKRLQWKTGAVEDGHFDAFWTHFVHQVWPDLQKI